MDQLSDVPGTRLRAARLDDATLRAHFADAHPALGDTQARIEADRCFYCFDAPCIEACPTGIDIPGFIGRIADGNLRGSAEAILGANIFGGSCARVCPTEILCEQACVRTKGENKPVKIGLLQRHATDHLMRSGEQPFARAAETGRHVAVVGAGPAGLACAHRLALLGHRVSVFEARRKGGGLNEYGVAAYKLPGDYAQRELDFILGIGGIEIAHGRALGRDITLSALRQMHDAVFLALGHQAVRVLSLSPETLDGVSDAARFIEMLRQTEKNRIAVGNRVVVIGGGNTAIDAAMQAKRLGARDVTIAYRRGLEHMSATKHEQEWARLSGIRILPWHDPTAILGENGVVTGVLFADTGDGAMLEPADMVLLAVGQLFDATPLAGTDAPLIENGRIAVDATGRTSVPMVWAGGDCTAGADLTVAAVQDGKVAAMAIHAALCGEN